MSREISLEAAHAEACLALGEAVLMQRLLGKELQRVTAERDDLLYQANHAPDPSG